MTDVQIVTRVSGPEVGYVTTPIAVVESALTILDERVRRGRRRCDRNQALSATHRARSAARARMLCARSPSSPCAVC